MQMGIMSLVKLIAIVIVGLFVFKLASKWITNKFPNKVTQTVDSVVSAA